MVNGLDYIHSLTKWKGRGGFTLEPLKSVLSVLGDPQDRIKTVHVGGTNGKGSVSTYIASILGQAGYKVGLNISPHLKRFNERVVIDGHEVDNEFFNEFGALVQTASEKAGVELSFHEAITAVSFAGFAALKVDYGVIEVGLGGRLDASNVIKHPEVSVIVSIGHDHEDVLGVGLDNIAREKGGILKSGSVGVIGEIDDSPLKVLKSMGLEKESILRVCGEDYTYQYVRDGLGVVKGLGNDRHIELEVPLLGRHQVHNAAVATIAAFELGMSDNDIRTGIKNTFWPARLEFIEYRNKKLLIDCAHNREGIQALTKFIKDHNYQDVNICFGALDTKNWRDMVDLLIPLATRWMLVEPLSERAVRGQEIANYLSCSGIRSKQFGEDYIDLLNNINRLADNSLILLTGSIYFVGEFRSLLDIEERPLWIKRDTSSISHS